MNQLTPIQEYVNEILKVDYLDEMFAGYILNQDENDEFNYEKYREKFNELIISKSNETERNLNEFLNLASEVNGEKQKLLFSILESSIKENDLSSL